MSQKNSKQENFKNGSLQEKVKNGGYWPKSCNDTLWCGLYVKKANKDQTQNSLKLDRENMQSENEKSYT